MDEGPPEDDGGFSIATLLHGTDSGWVSEPSEEIRSPSTVEDNYPGTESGVLDYTVRNDDIQDGTHEDDTDIDPLESGQEYPKEIPAHKKQESKERNEEENSSPPSLDTPDPNPPPTQASIAPNPQPPGSEQEREQEQKPGQGSEQEKEITEDLRSLPSPTAPGLGLAMGVTSCWSDSSSDSDSNKADEEEDDLPPYHMPSPEEIRMVLARKGHDMRLRKASFFTTPYVAAKLVPSLRRIAGLERGEKPTVRSAKNVGGLRHSLLNPSGAAERLSEKEKKVKINDESDYEWPQPLHTHRTDKGDSSESEDPIDQSQFDGFDEAFEIGESSNDAGNIPSFERSYRVTLREQETPFSFFPDPHEPLVPPIRHGGTGNNLEALRENFFRANPIYLNGMTNKVLQNASPLTRSVVLHWYTKVERRNETLRQMEEKLRNTHSQRQYSKSKINVLETQIRQLSDEIERLEDEKHAAAKEPEDAKAAQVKLKELEQQVENSDKLLASAKQEYDDSVNVLWQEKDEIQAALNQSRSDSDVLVEQIQNLLELVELAKSEDQEALSALREYNEQLQDDFNAAIKKQDVLQKDIIINQSQQVLFETQANNIHYLEQELNRVLQIQNQAMDRNKELEEENQILNQELVNAKEWLERNERMTIELLSQLDAHKAALETSNNANKVLAKDLEKSHQLTNETEKSLLSRIQELEKDIDNGSSKEDKRDEVHYIELENRNLQLKMEAAVIEENLATAEQNNRYFTDEVWTLNKTGGPVFSLLPLHRSREGVPRLIKPRYACKYATQKRNDKLERLREKQMRILQEKMDRNKAIQVAREEELFIMFGWDPQNPPNAEKYKHEWNKTAEQRWGVMAS